MLVPILVISLLNSLDQVSALKKYAYWSFPKNRGEGRGRGDSSILTVGTPTCCVCLCVGRGNVKDRKQAIERKEAQKERLRSDRLSRLTALWDKHRRCPLRIKERIQMAGTACCFAPDCSLNGTGQQVPCVSSKANAGTLYSQVNTPLESKVGSTREG